MSKNSAALAILETPYRSPEGHRAPVQYAAAVDPQGRVRALAGWLGDLAASLESSPAADLVSEAAETLRRASLRYAGVI